MLDRIDKMHKKLLCSIVMTNCIHCLDKVEIEFTALPTRKQ